MFKILTSLIMLGLTTGCSIDDFGPAKKKRYSSDANGAHYNIAVQFSEGMQLFGVSESVFTIRCSTGYTVSGRGPMFEIPVGESGCKAVLDQFKLGSSVFVPDQDFVTWSPGEIATFTDGAQVMYATVLTQLPDPLMNGASAAYMVSEFRRNPDQMVVIADGTESVKVNVSGDTPPPFEIRAASYSQGELDVLFECDGALSGASFVSATCFSEPLDDLRIGFDLFPANLDEAFVNATVAAGWDLAGIGRLIRSEEEGLSHGGFGVTLPVAIVEDQEYVVILRNRAGQSWLYGKIATQLAPVDPNPNPNPNPIPPPDPTPPPPEPMPIDGKALYAVNCAGCHGQVDSSSKRNKDATAITWAIDNIGPMKGLSFLSDEEIGAIALALSDKVVDAGCDEDLNIAARVWRLSNDQYTNTLNDLFDSFSVGSTDLVQDASFGGIGSLASASIVTELHAYKYQQMANKMGQLVQSQPTKLVDCNINSETCVEKFIEEFGEKTFRSPVTNSQKDKLMDLYRTGKTTNSANGVRLVVTAMLQSPTFLYRTELGEETNQDETKLTSWEVAAKLSYFLWNTAPDARLLSLARGNLLSTTQQVMTETNRMLADSRSRSVTSRFFIGLTSANEIKHVKKDSTRFPRFNSNLAGEMLEETKRFVEHITWDKGGTLNDLFTAKESFLTENLARHYGISGVSGTGFRRVTINSGERSGLLTQGSILSVHADAEDPQPIHRGAFVRERLLCQTLAPPPSNINVSVPPPDPTLTTRERYARHSSDPACSGCHELTDPIGFGFENYNATGQFRVVENGIPVDASGEVVLGDDATGSFDGVVELSEQIGKSEILTNCISKRFFMFAHGATEPRSNSCSMRSIESEFKQSGGNLQQLVRLMIANKEFRYRTVQ